MSAPATPSVRVPVSVRVLVLAEELKGVLELLVVAVVAVLVAAVARSDRELDSEDRRLSQLIRPPPPPLSPPPPEVSSTTESSCSMAASLVDWLFS